MFYKRSDLVALRTRLPEIVAYLRTGHVAVEVALPGGSIAWVLLDEDLRALCNWEPEAEGSIYAELREPEPYRRRGKGDVDILGEELRRLGLRLFGNLWWEPMGQVLGLPASAVKAMAARSRVAIRRVYSRKLKAHCEANGVDWRAG